MRKPQYRISSGGRGVHVRGFVYCTGDDVINIREAFGDDSERIRWDRDVKERPKDILWDEKSINGVKKKAGEWTKFDGREKLFKGLGLT